MPGRNRGRATVQAAVGDRAEDLVLKELLQTMDLDKSTGGSGHPLNEQYERLGFSKIAEGSYFGGSPPKPPHLSCDECGKPKAGLRCSQCQSAHYCDQTCQKAAWKKGHKAECGSLRARCEQIGKACAEALFNKGAFDGRVKRLRELDAEGAYAVAVRHGLFAGLTCALQDEADKDLTRSNWEMGICVSYMQIITTTVLRGERHRTDGGFGAIDEGRLVDYMAAESDGWQALLDAAVGVAHMVVEADFGGDEHTQVAAHRAGRDSWTFFQLALVHRRVARLIFFGDSADDVELGVAAATAAAGVGERCDSLLERARQLKLLTEAQIDAKTDSIARGELTEAALCDVLAPLVARAASTAAAATATRLAKDLKRALSLMWRAPRGRDRGSVIEANMSQVAAMLSYWTRELHVPVDFERVLDLTDTKRAMYRQMSYPMGEATIRKGRFLSQEETMALLQPMGPPPGAGDGKRAKGRNRQ